MEVAQGHQRASFPSAYQRMVPLNSLPKTRNPYEIIFTNVIRYNESKVLEITLQQCQALGKSFIDTVVKVMWMTSCSCGFEKTPHRRRHYKAD